ncbi:hypothetical protein HPP92_019645 [Vanilla planifolia]|uniref:NHL repeat-containing protein n=1 Tax=Vanilla planifolia TaxID=51239 RepID=A0A835Q7A3_VANPL|nr:hypothetical protein HPP92_019645 [Vanilla planifolia]
MRGSVLVLLVFVGLLSQSEVQSFPSGGHLFPTGAIVKHLKSFSPVLKWTKTSAKETETDADAPQFENGYFVETLVDGNKLGIMPYTIRVSPEGELFAVDSENNNVVKITPPLSQYSRARLVAGSFQGYSGHVDGKPSDARFRHPKGVAMDEKGNVYVADTANLAIRKIGESGVTTIAGGKSIVAGYRDGPSEDAKFSNDFDLLYVASTCSLLVVDRGNAALRQISLHQEDCDHHYTSISTSDLVMVIGAIFAGYISCLLQHGFGTSFFSKKQALMPELRNSSSPNKPALVVESLKEEPDAGWPSPGRLLSDLFKFAMEAIGHTIFNLILIPSNLLHGRKDLNPLKDNLLLPEDNTEPPPPLVQKQSTPSAMAEGVNSNIHANTSMKHQKLSKPPKYKDSSSAIKHRSTKRQEYADFYSAEVSQMGSKSQKERTRHRHREKGEPVETKPKDYNEPKFEQFNISNKYGSDNVYRF